MGHQTPSKMVGVKGQRGNCNRGTAPVGRVGWENKPWGRGCLLSHRCDNIVPVKPHQNMFFKQADNRNSSVIAVYNAQGQLLGIGNTALYKIEAPGFFVLSEKGSEGCFKQANVGNRTK